MPFSFGDEPLNVGESTAVNCMITKGDLPLNITWTLNEDPLMSGNDGITITRISPRLSALNIESIGGQHRGQFKCIASNAAGSVGLESELKANGEEKLEFCSSTTYSRYLKPLPLINLLYTVPPSHNNC